MGTNRQVIYVIVNIVTFDSYIGSSKDYPRRWAGHRHSLRKGVHRNTRMQKAWIKHGEGAFIFNVLERVIGDEEYLRDREQHFLDTLHPTYNIMKKASGRWGTAEIAALFVSRRGIKLSPEEIAKRLAGRQPITEETRAMLSAHSKKKWRLAKARKTRLDGSPLVGVKRQLKHPDATCTECGIVIVPKPGRRFTCSDECKVARNKRRVQSGAYREERECVECEAPFTVSNRSKDTEACSKKCAALVWRREERDKRTVNGLLMCRKNLHVIEASDPRCAECYKVSNRARYHRSVADVPRRSWSHDGPRSAKRKIAG